jgi:4-hydroxyacetophenone monooxygenase
VLTASGRRYQADILAWATGSEASRFLASLDIVGRGGVSLRQAWDDDDARAYLGVTVPGLPNLFMLDGPDSFPGSGSFVYFMEVQMRYVAQMCSQPVRRRLKCAATCSKRTTMSSSERVR